MNATAGIEIWVLPHDLTADRQIASQVVHANGCGDFVSQLCGNIDEGSAPFNIATTIVRGHTYELKLRGSAKADVGIGIGVDAICDFKDLGGFGIRANFFELTVEPDLVERIEDAETGLPIDPGDDGDRDGGEPPSGGRDNLIQTAGTQRTPGVGALTVTAPGARSVTIRYVVAQEQQAIELSIYDITGRRVRTLERSVRSPGEYSAHWDRQDQSGTPVASGVYFARLRLGDRDFSKKVVIVR